MNAPPAGYELFDQNGVLFICQQKLMGPGPPLAKLVDGQLVELRGRQLSKAHRATLQAWLEEHAECS